MSALSFQRVTGIGEVKAGDDLAALLAVAMRTGEMPPVAGDVLVVTQKIVSKAEGRSVDLCAVMPLPRAVEIAALTGKDARMVELILSESSEIMRVRPNILIVRHRLGFVMANAGIDCSNVPSAPGEDRVLLLPRDPDRSAAVLRDDLYRLLGIDLAVVISDSFGRPWRNGVVNVALGAAGLPALIDRRGERDRQGRALEVTQVAFADAIAAAAGLVMGEADEGVPAVLLRGLSWSGPDRAASALVRPLSEDLFR